MESQEEKMLPEVSLDRGQWLSLLPSKWES